MIPSFWRLLNVFAPNFQCHVEYKIILYCCGSRMVNEKLSFTSMLLINCQLRQVISALLEFVNIIFIFLLYPPPSFYLYILFTFKVSCFLTTPPPRGLLDFWNGGANVLIWGLQFGVGEIIWGVKFQVPKCALCCLKFGVGEIIWGLIFLVCHCASHFLSIEVYFGT